MQQKCRWWQPAEVRARICFKKSHIELFYFKKSRTLGRLYLCFFPQKATEVKFFVCDSKVLKCVCLGIMGISSVRKESRCASLDYAAERLSPALLQFQSLCCQPSPESGAVPSAWGNSSQAWPTRLFWSVNAAGQRPPSSHALRAARQTTASQDGSSQPPPPPPPPPPHTRHL